MSAAGRSVNNIKASITTMQTYLDNVDTWYSTYTSAHSEKYCKNLTGMSMHGDIATAKLTVENVILKIEDYLDDTGWIATLREHKSAWSTAESECAGADLDVLDSKLRAQESWEGSAGTAYRGAVTAQQGSIAKAERAASVMVKGCENGAVAGESYFAALDEALAACVSGLPTQADFPPWSGTMEDRGSNTQSQTAYGHDLQKVENSCDTHASSSGKSASSTCKTATETALTEFTKSFTDAFKTYPDHAYPYAGSRPNLTVNDVVGTWPKAPGEK